MTSHLGAQNVAGGQRLFNRFARFPESEFEEILDKRGRSESQLWVLYPHFARYKDRGLKKSSDLHGL